MRRNARREFTWISDERNGSLELLIVSSTINSLLVLEISSVNASFEIIYLQPMAK